MRLLVSVRSEEETSAALLGGADIIDAKEPRRGSLGAVTPDVLAEIGRRVPREVELSVALGDHTSVDQVTHAIARVPVLERRSATYVKLGLAGVSSDQAAASLLRVAVSAARQHPVQPRPIAVAYADWEQAESLSPEALAEIAAVAGVAGLLVDTRGKDGRNLLHWLPIKRVSALVAQARGSGLVTALAGSLQAADLAVLSEAAADVVGVRGAACAGGREGRVSTERVRRLRRQLGRTNSGFVQEAVPPTPF